MSVPIAGKRNIMITSALPYVNNVPHLGNIIGCVLSADAFARYCRNRGYVVLFVCGTDEHGTSSEIKAIQENCSPEEVCNKYHAIHKEIYDWFDIKFDAFGRTSTPKHTEICQSVFKKVDENGWLEENEIKLPYCGACQRFLADRFIEGTCPFPGCDYDKAHGEQCDKCGYHISDQTPLVNPKCKICGNDPVFRDSTHLFLNLTALEGELANYISTTAESGRWSENAKQITNAWLKEGLKKRCITRDLKWGVPVPREGFENKVLYVWFDAPIGYVSITASHIPEWELWWKNPDYNVELYQFMGKDNVQFHSVMFPSTLIATGENWTMAKTISATEFLNYESGKFSKSNGIGVFGNDAKGTKIPAEGWRYSLLANRPEVSDSSFTWTDLQAKLNNELLNNLGNFINRVLSFIAKSGYGSIIPDAKDADSHLQTKVFGEKVANYVKDYIDSMEKVKLKQGLNIAMSISRAGNAYLQETRCWDLYKKDQTSCSIVIKTAAGVVHLLACLLEPFMPSFSLGVLKQLNLSETKISLEEDDVERARRPWEILPAGHKIGNPVPLFRKLGNEEVESYRERFAGSQAERAARLEEKLNKTKLSDGNITKKDLSKSKRKP